MATVVDAARDGDKIIACAAQLDQIGTARGTDFNQSFDVYQSIIETHVGYMYEAPVNNTADSNAPQVEYDTAPFWYPSTPATVRA